MIDFIENGESGLSVRNKLNSGIDQINTLWTGTQSGTNFGGGGGSSSGGGYLDDETQTATWKTNVQATGASWTHEEAELLNQFITQVDASGYLSKLLYVAPMLGSNIYSAAIPLIDTLDVGSMWLANSLHTGHYIRNSGVIFVDRNHFIAPFNVSTESTVKGMGGLLLDKVNVSSNSMMGYVNDANDRGWNITVSKTSNYARFTWGSSSASAASQDPSPVDNTFYYGQSPNTSNRQLYVSGILEDTNTDATTPAGENDQFFRVGGSIVVAANASGQTFSGTLGLALFTDGSLTEGEALHLNNVIREQFETGRRALTDPDTMPNPMLERGDMIVGGVNGKPERLGSGNDGQVLGQSGGWFAWIDQSGGGGGGFTNPMIASGDLILGGNAGDPARLPIGSDGQVLTVNGTTLSWADSAGGGSSPLTTLTGKYYTEPKLVASCRDANYDFNGAADTWIHANVFTGVDYSGQGFSYDVNSGIFYVEESGWYDITASWVSYINNTVYERGIRMADSGNTTVYQVAQGYGRTANYDSLHLRTYFTGGENFTFFGRKGTASNSLIFNAPNGGLRVDKLVEATGSQTLSSSTSLVAHAKLTANSGIVGGSLTAIEFGFDSLSGTSSDWYDTTNRYFTPQESGSFHLNTVVRFQATAAAGRFLIYSRVNGTTLSAKEYYFPATSIFPTMEINEIRDLNTGDVYDIQILKPSASTETIRSATADSFFKAYKL